MKCTAGTLRLCMELAERVGTVTDAHLYNAEFITIDGETSDGKHFSITVSMKEEENKDA